MRLNLRDGNFFLLMVVVLLVVTSMYTIEMFPVVWGDEVMFTEPAANLASSGRFVSLAWPFQSDNTIWAGNAPMHSFLLAGWISLFNTSIASVRSFGIFEYYAALTILIVIFDKYNILSNTSSKFIFLILLGLAYGTSINYRSGRYDPTGILILVGSLYLLTSFQTKRLSFLKYLPCLLIVSAGLHLAIYSSICLCAVYVFSQSSRRNVCIKAFVALGVGGFLFITYLIAIGQLAVFIESARYLKSIPEGALPKDPSLVFIFISALAVLVYPKIFSRKRLSNLEKILLSILLATPCVFILLGRYPTYYSWMMLFPAAILLGMRVPTFFESLRKSHEKYFGIIISLILVTACAVGLPLQLASSWVLTDGRDYDKVRRLISQIDGFGGPVLVDPAAWYAARPFSTKIYLTTFDRDRRLMSPAERQQVRFIVASKIQFELWKSYLGGEWIVVGQYHRTDKVDFLGFKKGFGDKLVESYDLVAFSRISK